jgi:hypothetical protein
MARRIGDIEEFEFKAVGGNHNQGVSPFIIFSVFFSLGGECVKPILSRLLIGMMIQTILFEYAMLSMLTAQQTFLFSATSSWNFGFRTGFRGRRFYKALGGS